MSLSRAYLSVRDQKGNKLSVIAVRRPPRKGNQQLKAMAKNNLILGISSCRGFPKNHAHAVEIADGWCHCFRRPKKFGLNRNIPLALISESDFMMPQDAKPTDKKVFDFIFMCMKSYSQRTSKNVALMERCLPVLINQMGLRGRIVGYQPPELQKTYGDRIVWSSTIKHSKLMGALAHSRFAFFPNIMDASPRFLGEALSLNVPSVVNERIYGGWKYINENTGVFFNDETNIEESVQKILDCNSMPVRDWWTTHYGPRHASEALGSFIRKINPKIDVGRAYFFK